jgi:hypothetical protein
VERSNADVGKLEDYGKRNDNFSNAVCMRGDSRAGAE